jgi:hypothetical protein
MSGTDWDKFEEIAFDYLLKKYGWKIITTPKFARVDGVACKNNEITHVVEFKSRNMTLASLERFGTYLISYDKIEHGIKMATMMRVPFILLVYLIGDDVVIGVEIGDMFGISVPMEIKETRTQKNSREAGDVMRRNAFIDLEDFSIL